MVGSAPIRRRSEERGAAAERRRLDRRPPRAGARAPEELIRAAKGLTVEPRGSSGSGRSTWACWRSSSTARTVGTCCGGGTPDDELLERRLRDALERGDPVVVTENDEHEIVDIDPSLFTTPVTKATWKSVQGDPNATPTDSPASIFHLWGGITDPNHVETNQVLAFYRLQLQNRAIQHGPPPYAQCP